LLAVGATLLVAATGVGGDLTFVIGSLLFIALVIPGQLKHNRKRREVVANFRRSSPEMTPEQRRLELDLIERTYGRKTREVKALIDEAGLGVV
jgi:hypothetical protein